MQQDILIIGVLFPAIPLMMVNFGNRYTVLATLIRHLHDEVIRDSVSPNDAERFLLQISRLRDRLRRQVAPRRQWKAAVGTGAQFWFRRQSLHV